MCATRTHPWASTQAFDLDSAIKTLDAALADLQQCSAKDEVDEAAEDASAGRLDQVYPPVPAVCVSAPRR